MKFAFYKQNWWKVIDETNLKNATLQNIFIASKPKLFQMDLGNLVTTQVTTPEELNFEHTPLQNPQALTGWLTPNGDFLGCDDQYHSAHARYVQKATDESDLERKGWLKITYLNENRILPFYKGHPEQGVFPSMEQIRWIDSHLYCDTYELKEARRLGLFYQNMRANPEEHTPTFVSDEPDKTK